MKAILGLGLVMGLLAGCGSYDGEDELGAGSPADLHHAAGANDTVPTEEKVVARGSSLETARRHAQTLLHSAGKKASDPRAATLFGSMANALGRASLDVPPPGRDLKACVEDPRTLAYVNTLTPGVIHICARASRASAKRLGQVLIHETAHVVGVHDECAATRIEVAVQRAAGGRLSFKNGYMKGCGIE